MPDPAQSTAPKLASPPAAAPERCKNCGAVLAGRFCANCSQAADVHVPTTVELVHELMEGVLHTDSRLWRTLRLLLLNPGRLTEEFVAGRRMAYLPPFRLYLVVSIIFFLLASLSHPHRDAARPDSVATGAAGHIANCDGIKIDGLARYPGLSERVHHACRDVMRDSGSNLMHVALATMSKAMFIFLPLVAFLHMLLYWRPRYRYAEHLVFFVHLHAFYFCIAFLELAAINVPYAWPTLQGAADGLETLLGWLVSIYTVIAVRRVFASSWPGALIKSFVLAVIYVAVFSLTVGAVFIYALLQL